MPGKFKIVVSDLHLGAGRVAEGNLLEDFERDQEFAAFLEDLVAESDSGGAEVELIINGDAFEMLQVPHLDAFDPAVVYPSEHYYSSSAVDSVRKMALILAGHRPFFEALGRFMWLGPPRRYVTFINGNHDVNLFWPAVQHRIRQAVGATSGRASLLVFEECRVSREGIYVEHGNQYADFWDRLDDMEEPLDQDQPDQLALPLGSWFVMDVFNEVKREKYWINGVKPIMALVWYALAYDFPFAARSLAALIRALPGIIGEVVLDADDPRARLVRQLEDPDQVAEMGARYESDEAFRAQFNAQVASILSPPPELPGDISFAVTTVPDPVSMGDQIQAWVQSSLYEAAKARAAEEQVKLVVFGHTHEAGEEPLPDGGKYVNSGTWTWWADFSGEGKETWQDLFEHPGRFMEDRRLSYVRIDYDGAGQPVGRLSAYEPAPDPNPGEDTLAPLVSLWEWLMTWLQEVWARITSDAQGS